MFLEAAMDKNSIWFLAILCPCLAYTGLKSPVDKKHIEQMNERVIVAKRDVKNSVREQDKRLQQKPDPSEGGVCRTGFYFITNIALLLFL